jgi:hypothetical protein
LIAHTAQVTDFHLRMVLSSSRWCSARNQSRLARMTCFKFQGVRYRNHQRIARIKARSSGYRRLSSMVSGMALFRLAGHRHEGGQSRFWEQPLATPRLTGDHPRLTRHRHPAHSVLPG